MEIYATLLQSLGGIVWEADPESGRFLTVNANAEELLGYAVSAWLVTAAFWRNIIHNEDRDAVVRARAAAIASCEAHELEYRVTAADGRLRWVRDTAQVLCTRGRAVRVVGFMVDVTASREQAQRERYYRALIENSADAIALLNRDGTIRFITGAVERISGFTSDELAGRLPFDLMHPDDAGRVRRAFLDLLQHPGKRLVIEYRGRQKDGSWKHREVVAVNRLDDPAVDGVVVNYRDTNDRRLAESQLEETSARLRQSQKMEAVGRLAGGVAHDFNNLLTVIVGFSELAATQLAKDHPALPDIEETIKAGRSAALLTRQLLAFSRKQILQPEIVDLNVAVRRIESLLRRTIGEDIRLVTKLAARIDRISADPGQIEQVIMKLAVNARDAMLVGGVLTIETANVTLDNTYAAAHPGSAAGPHVMLAIGDTGVGMDSDVQAHLFEPFFTTKEPGKGTGLGLATVYGIVKQSGGSIFVYSEPGRGTVFKIFLPRAEQKIAGAKRRLTAPSSSLAGTETILLVEDQPEVRLVTRETLSRHGYRVVEAANGADALAAVKGRQMDIHLLITDVVMPGMSGRSLARALAELRPDLRVLFTSGYTDEAIVHHGVLDPGVAFLQKPFDSSAFLRKVRDVLDAPKPPLI